MKKNRREFIKVSAIGGAALLLNSSCTESDEIKEELTTEEVIQKKPIVISTWEHGLTANEAAWEILASNGAALDAVEAGVRVSESDPENLTVGLGGLPDRDGIVTLDACIMDHNSKCGAVACLEEIENPISVARKVMEETPHVMLVGKGAQEFAVSKGFERKNLLTSESIKQWKEWLEKSEYEPIINIENHDTIGMLALDEEGNLAGACTTSGMAYKLHGRVGDSPIIGAGLFVDNEVGAACATGVGEAVIRVAGSAMVVELMRNGKSPADACKEVVNRIVSKHENVDGLQVGFLALNKNGEYGSHSVYEGFNVAVAVDETNELVDSNFDKQWD